MQLLKYPNQLINALGHPLHQWINQLGEACLLMLNMLTAPGRTKGVLKETYKLGVLSLTITLVAGFFVGMVLGLQGYYTLTDYGAENSIGVMVALTLTRELAPVMGAILYAGRSGSSMTTEIGLMKTTEQLSALDLMGIDPLRFVYRPRLIAGLISVPILTIIFMAIGIIGAWLVSVQLLAIDDGAFWSQMQAGVSWSDDVVNGVIKSIVFALVVNWLALYFGHSCLPSSEGVGLATTATVVYASLAVLGLDFILTALMFQ